MADAITTPGLEVNGAVFPIVPNSLTTKKGTGTVTCVAQSIGGGATEVVHKKDVSAAVSYLTVKFEITTTAVKLVQSFLAEGSTNTLIYTDPLTGFRGSVSNASVINEVEYEMGVDGTGTLEFCGAPAKFSVGAAA